MRIGDDRRGGAEGQPRRLPGEREPVPGPLRSKAPRALLLCTSLDVGGAERVLAALARGLPAHGIEAEAACLLPAGPVARSLREEGVRVHDLALRSKAGFAGAALTVARLLVRGGFGALASLLFHANQVARAAVAIARTHGWRGSHAASVHIVEAHRPWRRAIERLALPLSGRTVFVSEEVRRRSGARGLARAVVIPNGVPIPARPSPLDASAPWVALGRIHPQKGHDVLLEAWAALGATAPRLVIAGRPGPASPSLQARAAALALPVEWAGEVSLPQALLLGARGFVLASRDEGHPLALLEAMAAGLPCVATRVGGVPEALTDGREGVLVASESPAALAAAVRALEEDRARAAALGRAARERAEREHGEGRMVERWARVLEAPAGTRIGS